MTNRAPALQHVADVEHYQAYGFCVVPSVFAAAEMQELGALVSSVVAREEQTAQQDADSRRFLTTPGRHNSVTPRSVVEVGADGSVAWELNRPTRFFPEHRRFAELARDQRLAKLAGELLGGEPLLFADQAFLKPPANGGPRPIHQDNWYFHLTHSANCVTAWVALDDADDQNGALRYLRGSHILGVVPHSLSASSRVVEITELAPADEEVVAAVRQGGVVFHHGAAMHWSGPNSSHRHRRAYGVHYVRRGASFWKDSQVGKMGFPLGALLSVTDGTLDVYKPDLSPQEGRVYISAHKIGMQDKSVSSSGSSKRRAKM